MKNKDIILFILVICVSYLILCHNKKNKEIKDLKESFTNSKESFTNGNESITESINNLALLAQEIQEDGDYIVQDNRRLIIPIDSNITFEGPAGKGSILYFNPDADGLEIAQIGGANKLRLYVENSGGFDIGMNTLTTSGSDSLVLTNDIRTTSDVVADSSVDSKTALRLINANSQEKFKIHNYNIPNSIAIESTFPIIAQNNNGDSTDLSNQIVQR